MAASVRRKKSWIPFFLRYGLGFGLVMGIGIPTVNLLWLPEPGYDYFRKLTFSVPVYVLAWTAFSIYLWRRTNRQEQGNEDS